MDSLYINKGKEKIRKNDTKTKYIYIGNISYFVEPQPVQRSRSLLTQKSFCKYFFIKKEEFLHWKGFSFQIRKLSNMEKDKLFLKKAEKYHVFSSLERIKRDEKQIRFLLPKNQKLFLKMVKIHYVFFMQ